MSILFLPELVQHTLVEMPMEKTCTQQGIKATKEELQKNC